MFATLMLVALEAATATNEAPPSRLRNPAAVVTFQDYPDVAQRRSEYGIVSIVLGVSADGKASSCDVTETSGSAVLDARTCALFKSRARFDPVANGNHASAEYRTAVGWGTDTRFASTKMELDLKVSRIPADYRFPTQAQVVFGATGHVDLCTVTQSSGSVAADEIACRQIGQRLAIPAPKSTSSAIPPAAVRTVAVSLIPQSSMP